MMEAEEKNNIKLENEKDIESKPPIRRVYLKTIIRQDSTGIWTVVGYDTASK